MGLTTINTPCSKESDLNESCYEKQNRVESNSRTYSRTINKMIISGKGSVLVDEDGKEYIDCLACAGTLALGHNNPEITSALKGFLDTNQIIQGLDILTPAKYAFTMELLSILPLELREQAKVQFCGPTGADAAEAAIKLFKTATGRKTIFSFHGAYHGMTAGSLALTGNLLAKNQVGTLMPDVHFFPFPYEYRNPYGVKGEDLIKTSLCHIETVLADPESGITKPAAIILEAIQGEGGCIPAPDMWLKGLRNLCDIYDIPLILDEVQSGLGRTGQMFAFEKSGIIPDAILLSKVIGGSLPMSVVVYKEKYDTWKPGAHAGTFRGNQMAMVAGQKTMEIIKRDDLCGASDKKGELLKKKLLSLKEKHAVIGDVRGRGLMLGIEIIQPVEGVINSKIPLANGVLAGEIKKICFQQGLIIETGGRYGAVLRFLPALTISENEITKVVDILDSSINLALKG